MQPDQRAQRRAGAEDRVGIDVACRFRGRCRPRSAGSALRRRRRAPASRRPGSRPARSSRPSSTSGSWPARSRATLPTSSVPASVCTACQRLNGSLSCAAISAQVVGAEIGGEPDRRREIAVGREHRPLGHAGEDEALRRLVQHQHAAFDLAAVGERQRQVAAVAADQTGDQRNDHRLFGRLAGRRRDHLGKVELVGLRRWHRSGRTPPPPACRPANTSA